MLTEWRLINFKAANGNVGLQLHPVTVLAGLNSSGKSSLLQSILVASQTLSNTNAEKALILNGPLVQLGTADQVLNDLAEQRTLGLGFTYRFERGVDMETPFRSSRQMTNFLRRALGSVSVSAEFSATAGGGATPLDSVRVELKQAMLRVSAESSDLPSFVVPPGRPPGTMNVVTTLKHIPDNDQRKVFAQVGESFLGLLPLGGSCLADIVTTIGADTVEQKELLARRLHFLPTRFMQKFNVSDRLQQDAALSAELAFRGDLTFSARTADLAKFLLTPIPSTMRDRVNGVAAKRKDVSPFSRATYGELIQWARAVPLKTRAKSAFTNEIKVLVAAEFFKVISADADTGGKEGIEVVSEGLSVSMVETAVERLTAVMMSSIRYLGPLRADPQAAQRFAPSNEPDDVGMRGEYAAAVYDANRNAAVAWVNPVTGEPATGPLEAAVDWWANYLGIAHHLSTKEASLAGVSWLVQLRPKARERPLEAVGVGVSQVLPILVAGLLAPRGAIILIEQPELHLHPRAQALLADFFLSLQQTGKQCIIETHSDCLVGRFRLKLVSNAKARQAIGMYFVQQDERGSVRFDRVTVSASGDIENWPAGFFDEAMVQEDQIAREAIRARAQKLS